MVNLMISKVFCNINDSVVQYLMRKKIYWGEKKVTMQIRLYKVQLPL